MSEQTQPEPAPDRREEREGAEGSPAAGGPVEPTHVLVRTAVLAGLTRLVPLPFVDDFLLRRARRHQVDSLLELHGRSFAKGEVAALSSESGSCLCGLVGFVVLLPITLVVKLIKKLFQTVFFVLALRAAVLAVAATFMLGRTLHRELGAGALSDGAQPPERVREAQQLRTAFEATFKGSDWRLLTHAIGAAWSGAGSLLKRGGQAAQHGLEAHREGQLEGEDRAQVEALSQRVERALDDPKVRSYLADFDRRFAEKLAEVRAGGSA
ncbi:MAG: hypothetical protein KDD82_28490 [Planctomycetes bacterium]|nr:hypothetical protein [Planctomycetota bacterium]